MFIYTVSEKYLYTSLAPEKPVKYLYIGLHLSNTFPGQKKAIVVFKFTSPVPEKYLYTPCRRSIYTLLRRRRSIYIHPLSSSQACILHQDYDKESFTKQQQITIGKKRQQATCWSTSRFMGQRLGICATIVRRRIRPLRGYDFDRRINAIFLLDG